MRLCKKNAMIFYYCYFNSEKLFNNRIINKRIIDVKNALNMNPPLLHFCQGAHASGFNVRALLSILFKCLAVNVFTSRYF